MLDGSAVVLVVVQVSAVAVVVVVAVVLEPAVGGEGLFVVAVVCLDSFVVVQGSESGAEAPYEEVATGSHVYPASMIVVSSVVHVFDQGEPAVRLSAASACCASCLLDVVVAAAVVVALAALAFAACPPILAAQMASLRAYPGAAAAFGPDIVASSVGSSGSACPSSYAAVAGLPS